MTQGGLFWGPALSGGLALQSSPRREWEHQAVSPSNHRDSIGLDQPREYAHIGSLMRGHSQKGLAGLAQQHKAEIRVATSVDGDRELMLLPLPGPQPLCALL